MKTYYEIRGTRDSEDELWTITDNLDEVDSLMAEARDYGYIDPRTVKVVKTTIGGELNE